MPALHALLGIGVAGRASTGRARGTLELAATTLVVLPMLPMLPALRADFTSEQAAQEHRRRAGVVTEIE